MTLQEARRDHLVQTLKHLKLVFGKVRTNAGINQVLTFPDQHKLADGLLLSGWTHWEQFVRELMIIDLSEDPKGLVRRRATRFRSTWGAYYLAQELLDHPDEAKWVEWSSPEVVRDRADACLGVGHRFSVLKSLDGDLNRIKRIRNAIAHKSDHAWEKFRSLVIGTPFLLKSHQLKGLTTGRFLCAHQWVGQTVLEHALDLLEDSARKLVP